MRIGCWSIGMLLLVGCSGSGTSGSDDGSAADSETVGVDGVDEGDGDAVAPDSRRWVPDATHDWSGTEFIDATVPDLPYVAECGNGVIDPGEECDDFNRMNGDGCDWLCQEGNGDPPPTPDPTVDDYEPVGDGPTELPGLGRHDDVRAVLEWTGTEFATAHCEDLTPDVYDDDEWAIHFRRFNRDGRALDADWLYPGGPTYSGTDLVWTGAGFGLFWLDRDWGIVLMLLDAEGKPVAGPMLVEPDTTAGAPSADWTGSGFVLAWPSGTGGSPTACSSGGTRAVRVALVAPDGSTDGLVGPVVVDDTAMSVTDVAAGPDGFGILTYAQTFTDRGSSGCGARLIWVSSDLSRTVLSGALSEFAWAWDVRWADGAYVTAWPDLSEGADPSYRDLLCVGRFGGEGELEGPPVCSDIRPWGFTHSASVRLAAGDGGAVLVFDVDDFDRLLAVRTDAMGVPVGAPHDVFESSPGDSIWVGPYWAVEWAGDDAFGVLFNSSLWDAAFRVFERAESP